MYKYRYNNEIGFLDIDPKFLELGLKYAQKKAIDAIRITTLNQNAGELYTIDFHLIAKQEFVRSLILNDDFKIKNIQDGVTLSDMVSLTCLELLQPIKIEWSKLASLERLTVASDKYMGGVSALKSLKELCIAKSVGESAFQELTSLEGLHRLDIGGARLECLSGIHLMKALSMLSISYAPRLCDLSPIATLQNLKSLHIECCKAATDFSFLQDNSSIEELIIDRVNDLAFVPTMLALHSIQFTNCISGNLEPLLESKTLKDIYFYPNKKHYTHTIEQLMTSLPKLGSLGNEKS